jgi:hypothetical protein
MKNKLASPEINIQSLVFKFFMKVPIPSFAYIVRDQLIIISFTYTYV